MLTERPCGPGRVFDVEVVACGDAPDEDEFEDEFEDGGAAETCKGCFVDQRAHPPFSPPLVAPIHGVPTPSSPFGLVSEPGPWWAALDDDDDGGGGVDERLQTTSKGSFTPR